MAPEERAEVSEVAAEAVEANLEIPEISEGQPSSPPLYLSELPIDQRTNLPSTIEDQHMFNLTPAALAIVPKPRVSRHRSLEVSITKPTAEAPKSVQESHAKASDSFT